MAGNGATSHDVAELLSAIDDISDEEFAELLQVLNAELTAVEGALRTVQQGIARPTARAPREVAPEPYQPSRPTLPDRTEHTNPEYEATLRVRDKQRRAQEVTSTTKERIVQDDATADALLQSINERWERARGAYLQETATKNREQRARIRAADERFRRWQSAQAIIKSIEAREILARRGVGQPSRNTTDHNFLRHVPKSAAYLRLLAAERAANAPQPTRRERIRAYTQEIRQQMDAQAESRRQAAQARSDPPEAGEPDDAEDMGAHSWALTGMAPDDAPVAPKTSTSSEEATSLSYWLQRPPLYVMKSVFGADDEAAAQRERDQERDARALAALDAEQTLVLQARQAKARRKQQRIIQLRRQARLDAAVANRQLATGALMDVEGVYDDLLEEEEEDFEDEGEAGQQMLQEEQQADHFPSARTPLAEALAALSMSSRPPGTPQLGPGAHRRSPPQPNPATTSPPPRGAAPSSDQAATVKMTNALLQELRTTSKPAALRLNARRDRSKALRDYLAPSTSSLLRTKPVAQRSSRPSGMTEMAHEATDATDQPALQPLTLDTLHKGAVVREGRPRPVWQPAF